MGTWTRQVPSPGEGAAPSPDPPKGWRRTETPCVGNTQSRSTDSYEGCFHESFLTLTTHIECSISTHPICTNRLAPRPRDRDLHSPGCGRSRRPYQGHHPGLRGKGQGPGPDRAPKTGHRGLTGSGPQTMFPPAAHGCLWPVLPRPPWRNPQLLSPEHTPHVLGSRSLLPPPRCSVHKTTTRTFPSLIVAKHAVSTLAAWSKRPMCRSIMTALSRRAVGLAMSLPAMSGAVP